MPEVELSAGPIEYGDSGGKGRPIVFVGGLPHDERLWDGVVAELGSQFRCLTPVLPLGAQRKPLRPDADLSLPGLSLMISEFLERLGLEDAIVCFNDWGGAQTMISHGGADRVGAFVLVSCETADNYPPGVAGRIAALSGFMPGGFGVMRFALRPCAGCRSPTAG
jgi:pimeloyl-ACP methyl ester carboxylesterase